MEFKAIYFPLKINYKLCFCKLLVLFFSMNPYLPKKDHKFTAQGTQYKSLLERVNQILIHLLEDISFIYKSSGITFEVEPLLGVLVRLLTPFEILAYFHLTDVSDLVKIENNTTYARMAPNKLNNVTEADPPYDVKRQDLKLIPTPYEASPYEKKKTNRETNNDELKSKNHKNQMRGKFIKVLTEEQETTLIQWIDGKLKQNKYIRRKDISSVARKLSKAPGFIASKNWTIRFLSRYPQIKAQLDAISRANKGRRVIQTFSQISDSSESIQKFNADSELNLKLQQQQSAPSVSLEQKQLPSGKKSKKQEDSDFQIDSEEYSVVDESQMSEQFKKSKKSNSIYTKNGHHMRNERGHVGAPIRYEYGSQICSNQNNNDEMGVYQEARK